jgi:predicted glycogen debranching enzyme
MILSGESVAGPAGLEREWLITNGLGGYAMGTVAGIATRAYHGWLVAAERPPGGRRLRLAKMDIAVAEGDGPPVAVSSNLYPDALFPDGIRRMISFQTEPVPTWRYRVGSGVAEVSLWMEPGKNQVTVRVGWDGRSPVTVTVRPLTNDRDHHGRTHRGDWMPAVVERPDGWIVAGGHGGPLVLTANRGTVVPDPEPVWVERMRYPEEARRGYPDQEDHFSPGQWAMTLNPGDAVLLTALVQSAAAEESVVRDGPAPAWTPTPGVHRVDSRLAMAAAAYRVRTGSGQPSVVAGYPWFAEWVRDTCVALPGLYLATGRVAEATEVLARVGRQLVEDPLRAGTEENGHPVGPAADGVLWWIWALYRLWAYGGAVEPLLPQAAELLARYEAGLGPGQAVRRTEDGLVYAAWPGRALTWMDAACPDPVTPRDGYPVELTALYYKALRALDRMGAPGGPYAPRAAATKTAFFARFVRPDGLLYDRLAPDGTPDPMIRPNQLWAAAVPFPLLERDDVADLLEAVEPLLWTVRGLRTLAPTDPAYRGRYEGVVTQRDAAYHQGSAWPWLFGVWADAHHYAYPTDSGRRYLRDVVDAWEPLLEEAVLGQVAEVYDGDPPHRPGGAPAQAWSVAEMLRVAREWVAGMAPPVLDDPTLPPGLPEWEATGS